MPLFRKTLKIEPKRSGLLLDAEVSYETLFGSVPIAIMVADTGLVVRYINSCCEDLTGYSSSDAVGKMKCSEVFKGDACDAGCALKGCMATGKPVSGARLRVRNRNGQVIPVEVSACSILVEGRVIGGVQVLQDITDLVQAESQLAEGEQHASVIEGILEPFFVVDRNLTVTFMNQACADLTGYTVDEVVGKVKCHEVLKSSVCNADCAIGRCMNTNGSVNWARVIITTKFGKQVPVMVSAGAIRDSNGVARGGFEIIRDVSELAAVEDGIRDASVTTSASSEELAASVEEITAASKEVAQIAADVAQRCFTVKEASLQSIAKAEDGVHKASEASQAASAIAASVGGVKEDMLGLKRIAEKIGDILGIINGIADQTNLLALNAAIEAARAGEHGRGFAVVADEVRKLAADSRSSTKEIEVLIEDVGKNVENVEQSIRTVESETCRNVEYMGTTSEALGEILEAARGSKDGMEAIVSGIEHLAASAEELSASVEQVAGSAGSLAETAEDIVEMAGRLGL